MERKGKSTKKMWRMLFTSLTLLFNLPHLSFSPLCIYLGTFILAIFCINFLSLPSQLSHKNTIKLRRTSGPPTIYQKISLPQKHFCENLSQSWATIFNLSSFFLLAGKRTWCFTLYTWWGRGGYHNGLRTHNGRGPSPKTRFRIRSGLQPEFRLHSGQIPFSVKPQRPPGSNWGLTFEPCWSWFWRRRGRRTIRGTWRRFVGPWTRLRSE